ncbi:Uncharacterised protein [Starkeya nomas]|uniref:Uncharacterized protein n=1 Tax=Starkeya nomas TaxID=2666134 RepID=A0A5S9R3P0_9HYPH|nr:hypothetical protein [Starkeya nomas]CAA0128985.1 Uncharacterised protein [Starkeya nomas]
MARVRDQHQELPPLLAVEVRGRLSLLVRNRHELLKQINRMAPRSMRRLAAERDLARLTHEIIAADLALRPVGRKGTKS